MDQLLASANTLFDWVELWLACFSSMLDSIAEFSGIEKAKLLPEIATIQQKHGTSEYSFLIDEIPSLQRVLKGQPSTEIFAKSIQIYRSKRREHLRLYDRIPIAPLTPAQRRRLRRPERQHLRRSSRPHRHLLRRK